MPTSWRRYVLLVILTTLCPAEFQTLRRCPSQEAILPCRCLSRGQEIQVWCSHSNLPKVLEGLRAVGQYLQEPIDELILENNHLPSLPGKAFIPLRALRLMLRYNGLERVSTTWLSGLESVLMELFIVEPELRSLPENSLDRMHALEAVTIQTNLMKRIPIFSALPKLRYIQFESLSLVELSPRHFTALPALHKLHIVGSPRLTRLEGEVLKDLPSLALVNISFCGISWIHPRAITHLPALKELSLVGNKITDAAIIGRSIRDLSVLEVLRLDYNYVDKLGEASFVDLPSLQKLYLSNNKITELHHGAFHRVPKLRLLDLNRNLVRRIHPESFLQHSGSGLVELWLVDNDIGHVAELRALMDALPRLIFLDMSHNHLETIPFGALRGHPTLERLHLDHNKIHRIDREAFMAMPALRELRLRNNSLSDFMDGPMWNLPALKGLDLSQNYFRRLEPRLLANLPSLRKFDLSQNELAIVDPTTFLGTPALEHINMSHNVLTSLHPATFRHLLGLYELDVGDNQILEFVPGLPRGIEYLHMPNNQIISVPQLPTPDLDLPALRMLDLTGNGIKRISSGALHTLLQLRKLYMGKNSLQQLEDGSLDGLSRLEILDFHDNKIMQVHPKALTETTELRELKLGDNRMSVLRPEVLRTASHLKKLDISSNQLTEISSEILTHTRDIQIINASHNLLYDLPASLHGMKHLRILELSNNRLKTINPEILSSLISLIELRFSHNLVQELKKGAFDNLQHLKTIDFDNNELEIVEPHAFHSLPSLKVLKLSRNKLRELPNHVFSSLPALEIAEFQENRLKSIANQAFFDVPHLLMLNLSNNQLPGLDKAGLKNLRLLEMLDVSNNRLSRVANGNLDKMEWLVELRMDNNQICSVNGAPFNDMPRLRVLSMRNNKMMTFPEQSVQKLRGNLAVLDINGNPLGCSCSMLWFRAWLQESSAVGPRCSDGILLRDMRLSRQECAQEVRLPPQVSVGCEAELLAAPGPYGTSQIFSQWMNLKDNSSTLNSGNNKLISSPEESDYFYDEYVDYPYNETFAATSLLQNENTTTTKNATSNPTTQKSSHYVTGDTPTIYAASSKNNIKNMNNNIPKEVSSSPSSSGFTFFGVPLPNFNLNNLWNRGNNGRMTGDPNIHKQKTAERKTAIVNNVPPPPVRLSNSHVTEFLPTVPEIQSGGFIPLLPGSGGFKPIANPHLGSQISVGSVEIEKVNISKSSWPIFKNFSGESTITRVHPTTQPQSEDNAKSETSVGHSIPSIKLINVTTTTTQVNILQSTTVVPNTEASITLQSEEADLLQKLQTDESLTVNNDLPVETTTIETVKPTNIEVVKDISLNNSNYEIVTFIPQASNSDRFEDIFKEFVDNVSIPVTENSKDINYLPATSEKTIAATNAMNITETPQQSSNPLSPLLAPGAHYRPHGRPIITRVQSPHVSRTSPLQSDLEISDDDPLPLIHGRENKDAELGSFTTIESYGKSDDMSWYYINYNKTKLEPFIGPGGKFLNNVGSPKYNFSSFMLFLWTIGLLVMK